MSARTVTAQSSDQNERYRIAQSYEQNGEPDVAARMYSELLEINPTNDAFFNGVLRTYLALKKYDTLAVIIRSRMATGRANAGLYSLLGRTLFHAGHEKEAVIVWDSALVKAGTDEQEIRRVTEEMLAAHAYQAALDAFTRAEKTLDNKLLFAEDRANLYTMLSRYKDATLAYVQLLLAKQVPLAFVESRLSYFTMVDDGQRIALEVVRDAAHSNDDNMDLQYLLAWLLMERKAYGEAYGIYTGIDEHMNAGGQEIMRFATRALSENALDIAYKAFEKVRTSTQNEAIKAWAEFGGASVHERLWRRDAPDSIPFARIVAEEYDGVSTKYPNTTWADSATIRSALIRSTALNDLDGATSRLHGLITRNSRLAKTGEADLMLAEIFITQNLPDSATATAVRVLRSRSTGPDALQHARFLLGQVLYLTGDFDSAATVLQICTNPPNAPYANDAIALIGMIQESKDSIARIALRDFAQAELAARRHDYSRAVAELQDIVTTNAKLSIAEYALVAMGADYSSAGLYVKAKETYQRLLDTYPESILRDRAQFRIAALLEGPLHDPAASIRAYELLLENYAGSIFLEGARERIRMLRAQL